MEKREEKDEEHGMHEMHMFLAVAEMNKCIHQDYRLTYEGMVDGRDRVGVIKLTPPMLKKDPQHLKVNGSKLSSEEDLHVPQAKELGV